MSNNRSLPIEFRPYENIENVPNVQGIFAERLEFSSAIRHISRISPLSRNSMSGARGIWTTSKMEWIGTNPTRILETGESWSLGEQSLLPEPGVFCNSSRLREKDGKMRKYSVTGDVRCSPSVVQCLNNQCHRWVCAMPGWLVQFSDQLCCVGQSSQVVLSHMMPVPSFTFKHVMWGWKKPSGLERALSLFRKFS